MSFAGLSAVAAWAELPPSLRWAVPVFVDGALLAYTAAILIQRARGESTRFSWGALASFTGVSVAANAAHVLGVGDTSDWRTHAGAVIAAIAPLGVFAATHTVASLAIARPTKRPVVPLDCSTRDIEVIDVGQIETHVVPDVPPAVLARTMRDTDNLPLRDIADRLGVSKSTVSRWLARQEDEVHA